MASDPKPKKMIHLVFFDSACASGHMNAGQWKRPGDQTIDKDKLDYWLWMARLAERGKISAIFLADACALSLLQYSTNGIPEVYEGSAAAPIRGGTGIAYLDPFTIVAAMAAVTKSVGFGITGSTTYIPPYLNARLFSSLDHLSGGRVGWNIVTSWSKSGAEAFGRDELMSHDERYLMAEEYMDLVYGLWNGTWADDARRWDIENDIAYDPQKSKKIRFEGKYVKFTGRGPSHPSPQRTPFLFQAGTSKSGMAFAAKHAEGIYAGGLKPEGTTATVANIRAQAAAQGRDPSTIKVLVGITPFLGRTVEEAQAKYETALKYADPIAGLAQFSSYSGFDWGQLPLDEELDPAKVSVGGNGIQAIIKSLNEGNLTGEPWTPRRIGLKQAMGSFHPELVGTPEMVADEMERWIEIADADGFNIAQSSNPESFEDVVELLVPELQRRGLMQSEYTVPGGTLRENMLREPEQKQLRGDHYGSGFTFEKLDTSSDMIKVLE